MSQKAIEELLKVNYYTLIGNDAQVPLRATTQEDLNAEIKAMSCCTTSWGRSVTKDGFMSCTSF